MNETEKSGLEPGALDDDEIIDLTDEVPGSGEEEILDLTEEVSPPAEADEEIIDLVEEVAAPGPEDEAVNDRVEDAPGAGEDDAVLDLTDVTETPEDLAAEAAADDTPVPAEENVIDLAEADADDEEDEPDLDTAFALDAELDNGLFDEPDLEEDFSDTLGISLDAVPKHADEGREPAEAPPEAEGGAPLPEGVVSPGEIEAAVERVMEKMFSGKIDAMISEAIERAVSKEIEALKAALLDETSGNE